MSVNAAYEVNFDGLVGPTHNYSGLSQGNTASQKHGGATSSPRKAALEGLAKMKLLADLGLHQAVLPPQDRPDVRMLQRLGFAGSDEAVLQQAQRQCPVLLAAASSASSMWAANAATVSPSADTADGRVHFTAANLISQPHRWLEAASTAAILKAVFNDEGVFAHHEPLPGAMTFGDEGAANHTRLCRAYHETGVELFVYGRKALNTAAPSPRRFPARQTLQASDAIARLHGLEHNRTVFAQQNPDAIDAGVFHNDVIAVGNQNVLFYHRDAFVDTPSVIDQCRKQYVATCHDELICIEVTADELSIADAVKTYLFNSQLVTLPNGHMMLICPADCQHHAQAKQVIDQTIAAVNPIRSVRYVDVRQSMHNGGGPACLRLRVVLTDDQIRETHPGVFLTPTLYDELTQWIHQHYRETLALSDLADPQLLEESRAALDELTRILKLGSLYRFQKDGG